MDEVTPRRNTATTWQQRFPTVADLGRMADVALVGPNKPLGETSEEALLRYGLSESDLLRMSWNAGNRVVILKQNQGYGPVNVYSVYDQAELKTLLKSNASHLRQAGWPTRCGGFARRIHQDDAADPEVYRIVAEAFTDPRPEYRTKRYAELERQRAAWPINVRQQTHEHGFDTFDR
jgi:hypothetical protein